ncbi:MAG: HAMP domain-containing histidine kinase [Christensenellaceae bacterium]|nr:HAMP domain-containing histidine kinase [Christensenellaceae bacterium]
MFKKMRRRFVILIMIIAGLTVTGIFVGVFTVNSVRIKSSYNEALKTITRADIVTDTDGEFALPTEYNFISGAIKIKAVYIDDKLQVKVLARQSDATYSESEIYELANAVIMSKKELGELSKYEVRFFTARDEFKCYIITCCSTALENTFLKRTLGISVTSCVLCLIGIFIISEYMSYKFIQPAEQAWEQQSRFIADASHELKTPLTVILANNNIMLNHTTDPDEEKWLLSTKEEAETMKRMLEDMLYLAKSDARMLKHEEKTVDLSEVLFACSLTFDSVAFEKGVIINTDIEPNVEIKADEKEIRTIITILIDNAVKFSHNDKTIDISLKTMKNKAIFTITDYGEVVAESEIDRIFDRFYQTDKVRTKQGGGAGLGLAIAKSAVDRMKGEIRCTSSEENGTSFIVSLPLPTPGYYSARKDGE